MKKIFFILVLIFSVTVITTSCKKKVTEKSAAEKLQNKWTFINAVVNSYYSGANHITTVTGNNGDYMDFRADGKLYVRLQSSMDTVGYNLSGSDKIIIDGTDTLTIQTLTDNALKLYMKDVINASSYDEATYNLSR